jgi:hypothetical protein
MAEIRSALVHERRLRIEGLDQLSTLELLLATANAGSSEALKKL